jgi:hypothetical protein
MIFKWFLNAIYDIMMLFPNFNKYDTVVFALNNYKYYIYGIVYEPLIKCDWINIYSFEQIREKTGGDSLSFAPLRKTRKTHPTIASGFFSSQRILCSFSERNEAQTYKIQEKYFCNTFNNIPDFFTHVSICCEQKTIPPLQENTLNKSFVLFIYRHDGVYIFKVITTNKINNLCNSITSELSNVRLISVEYNHPGLEVPINIILPNNYYVVGNNLLSELFIKRYLDYNHGNIFNHNYTISIIDNNCKIIKLRTGLSIDVGRTKFETINCGDITGEKSGGERQTSYSE